MKAFLPMLAIFVMLSGCGTFMGNSLVSAPIPFEGKIWKEEVQLRNGQLIVVERATVPGQRLHSLNGSSHFFEPEQTITLPDGTIWSSLKLDPPLRMARPVLVDRDDRSWLIVVAPSFFGDHLRLGCPVPNLMYLRSTPSGWVRAYPVDVPDDLHLNLLLDSRNKEATPDVTTVSIEMKANANALWLTDQQEEYGERYFANGDHRYSWMNDLSLFSRFSKYCDPKISQCKQDRSAECVPSNLLIAPP